MGTESKVEQIVAAIKTDLEAITGDSGVTYWYTPGKVIRVDYTESRVSFKSGYGNPIYMVSDTGPDDPDGESAATGEIGRSFGVYVLCAYQDDRGERDPYEATTLSGTIRNRMLKDVVKKLELDRMLSGLAFVYDVEHGEAKRDFEEPTGWILGEAFFEVTYQHDIGDP
jgi:hypothetical protein